MSDDLTTETFHEPAASLTAGTILDNKFELLEQIGRGGMGVVWKANDRIADRLVALKFVPNEIKRFEVEMQRVRETFKRVHALQHHSICPLYTLEDGGNLGYYIVMKYLEGETLDAYVLRKTAQSETLPLNQVVALLTRAAVALDYAHQNGVIHRDIKPSNIFLVKSGGKLHGQIIDFGLADEIRTSMTRVSQARVEVSGTRPYMSPEQWRGRSQSAATDQYALAVVAYELLAGRVPFKNSDVALLRLAVMNDLPEPIPTISDSANAVLRKALSKDAADRFATCRDFIAALNEMWTTVGEEEEEQKKSSFSFNLPRFTLPRLTLPTLRLPGFRLFKKSKSRSPKYVSTSSALSDMPYWGWAFAGCALLLVVMLGAFIWGNGKPESNRVAQRCGEPLCCKKGIRVTAHGNIVGDSCARPGG